MLGLVRVERKRHRPVAMTGIVDGVDLDLARAF